jgi:uncharacterized phage protein gp47/JayE
MLKKTIFSIFFLQVLILSSAFADVGIQIIDLEERKMLVTYLWNEERPGVTRAVYPEEGYLFASSPIEIVSAVERNSSRELKTAIVAPPNPQKTDPALQSVLVYFASPVPQKASFLVEVSVQAKTDNISRDPDGNYIINYYTRHTAFFKLPPGHEIIYCNYPLLIYQIGGSTIVRVNESATPKKLIFKIRSYPDHS